MRGRASWGVLAPNTVSNRACQTLRVKPCVSNPCLYAPSPQAAAAAGVYLDRPSSAPSAAAAPHELSLASLSGDYRRLLIRPRHLEYSFTR